MAMVSEDIKDMLEAESGLALTFGTNLFIGREPTSPADTITIYDTPGLPPQLNIGLEKYEYPSVQIRCRNKDYVTGMDLMEDIKNVLHGLAHVTYNGSYYSVIYLVNGPAMLDWDEGNRVRFIMNFNIQRR